MSIIFIIIFKFLVRFLVTILFKKMHSFPSDRKYFLTYILSKIYDENCVRD